MIIEKSKVDNKMSKLLFRIDSCQYTGMGHLFRCLSIAQEAKKYNISSRFILYGDAKAASLIKKNKFIVKLYKKESLKTQNKQLEDFIVNKDEIVFLDFINDFSLSQPQDMLKLLKAWSTKVHKTILFDGSGKQSIRNFTKNPGVSMVIAPYVGETKTKSKNYISLIGPEFFVLNECYRDLPIRKIKKNVNQILVTCGGSDPLGITEKILSGLELIKTPLKIKIVLGPLFSADLIERIIKITDKSIHLIETIQAPKNLVKLVTWSDLSISTSGLTKYELAAAGSPMILISSDEIHEEINKKFVSSKCAISLGIYNRVNAEKIKKSVINLLSNFSLRSKMSLNGRKIIDGNGVKRVLIAISIKKLSIPLSAQTKSFF